MTSDDSSALSFRREELSVPDVSFVAAKCFPPRRRCAVEGAFVTAFPAPLFDADLRAQQHLQLFATDTSPSGAGAWSTPVSLELWTHLHDFSDEKGLEHEFDAHTGTSRLTSGVPGLVVDLPWVESFSFCFRYPQHINFLDLKPSSASFEGWWTVVSEIVVCSDWSTAELFLDQCV